MPRPEPRKIVAAMKKISLELNYKWPIPKTGTPEDFVQRVRERLIAFNWVGCVKLLRTVYGQLDEVPQDFGAAFHGAFALCAIALTVDVRKDSWKMQDPTALKDWGHGKVYEKAVTTPAQDLMLAHVRRQLDRVNLQSMLYNRQRMDWPALPDVEKELRRAAQALMEAQRAIRHEDLRIRT